jgi:hypothetical protein
MSNNMEKNAFQEQPPGRADVLRQILATEAAGNLGSGVSKMALRAGWDPDKETYKQWQDRTGGFRPGRNSGARVYKTANEDAKPSYLKNIAGGTAIGALGGPLGMPIGATAGAVRAYLKRKQWEEEQKKKQQRDQQMITQGYAQAHGYNPMINKAAFLRGYHALNKEANPIWNAAKNEYAGGGYNPLNWLGRFYDTGTPAKMKRDMAKVNAPATPPPTTTTQPAQGTFQKLDRKDSQKSLRNDPSLGLGG